ncbi:MAG: hypothetical protein LBD02_09090 [Christensenellaceae bacterium]|jgi:hypothetical protein|nr:hypothetical protein [Christensenellaceae bacterium]
MRQERSGNPERGSKEEERWIASPALAMAGESIASVADQPRALRRLFVAARHSESGPKQRQPSLTKEGRRIASLPLREAQAARQCKDDREEI